MLTSPPPHVIQAIILFAESRHIDHAAGARIEPDAPPMMRPGAWISRKDRVSETLFPEPDSPTIAKTLTALDPKSHPSDRPDLAFFGEKGYGQVLHFENVLVRLRGGIFRGRRGLSNHYSTTIEAPWTFCPPPPPPHKPKSAVATNVQNISIAIDLKKCWDSEMSYRKYIPPLEDYAYPRGLRAIILFRGWCRSGG